MDDLYLEIYSIGKRFIVPLETLIIIFIHNHCNSDFQINLILTEKPDNEPVFYIDSKNIRNCKVLKSFKSLKLTTYCILPIAIVKNITVISGLCSVARQIIKNTPKNSEYQKLLGFREACLMACNESSIWTKFCEIDIIYTVKNVLTNLKDYAKDDFILIAKDLSRFEVHMLQPVRIHNMYKVAQDQAKLNNKNISEINTSIPKENLKLNHLYGEGPYMTLADIILYPCIYILEYIYGKEIFKNNLPLTNVWLENMQSYVKISDFNFDLTMIDVKNKIVVQEKIQKLSLYVSDPKRYKPRNRIFTKQPDIEHALDLVSKLCLEIVLTPPLGHDVDFDWNTVPLQANPEGGALPVSRMKRKCEQLENLAKAVITIAKPHQVIVDFCSGSGHLGILLAVKLPECKIILLENKETSLERAKIRVKELNLSNLIFLQCNLDYFQADFDIGVSLHACGVATDLVIQHCLRRKASFVSCPCCYGGVHNCHHLTYPRSTVFKNSELSLRDYLVLGHSADQTHDNDNSKTKQGIQCMNIIDTDRKLQAEELGYIVSLSKMIPESCTPKNNILIGFLKSN